MGFRRISIRLFYSFDLEDHVPRNHLLRGINHYLDLTDIRQHLAEYYSHTGRPSIEPELMFRMLVIGYSFGIRSERKKVEMLFAHLKRILKLDKLRLRGPSGAHDEFLLAATSQNLRRMAKWLIPATQEAEMAGSCARIKRLDLRKNRLPRKYHSKINILRMK